MRHRTRIKVHVCECCGHPVAIGLDSLLPPIQRTIFLAVSRAGQAGIMTDDLIDVVYGGRADGGPLSARTSIGTHVFYLNRTIQRYGVRINGAGGGNKRGRPGGSGIYRLYLAKAYHRSSRGWPQKLSRAKFPDRFFGLELVRE